MTAIQQTFIRSGLYIGLMSGTSVDGIDAALVRLQGGTGRLTAKVLVHHQRPWPPSLRRRLLAVMAPATAPTAEICELNMRTAREFAEAANALLHKAGVKRSMIMAIGSHGQTICHLPPSQERKYGSTLQIGDPSVIATLTGITTVGNFRSADMAVAGQGAPLVPLIDKLLLTDARRVRCIHNLGGIANVTYLPPRGGSGEIIAFDTGPGNMLIDALISLISGGKRKFDRGGAMARTGHIHAPMLRKLTRIPYFQWPPPKSTGREVFGEPMAKALLKQYRNVNCNDLLATATELTAWSIAESYRRYLPRVPQETVLCGGGAENAFLVTRIQAHLDVLGCHTVRNIAELGIINQAKESLAFAVLAALTLHNIPGNLPGATGAQQPVVLGTVSRGLS